MTIQTRPFAGLASAILFGSLAGFLAVQPTPLRAANECLSGPQGAAPRGSHWYYRIDRATKKNCWYVRAEGKQTPSVNSAAALAAPAAEMPLQLSVANAHAEADAVSAGPPNGVAPEPAPLAAAANAPAPDASPADNAPSTVAARWLDRPMDTASASAPGVAESATPASPTPPAAAVPLAAETRSSPASAALPPLLLVIVGALAVAAGMTGVIFRFGSARRHAAEDFHHEQHAPWDVMDIGATIRSPPLAAYAASPGREPAHDRHEAVIPDEIVRLLSTLSKEAPA
ncbi:MAG TPA: hypothetical protein VFQ87_11525 [Bradyrhizobium sp.]|jgi:hypothetical protein|nr:hypothetical protein [Bradyrhizobium sp.]